MQALVLNQIKSPLAWEERPTLEPRRRVAQSHHLTHDKKRRRPQTGFGRTRGDIAQRARDRALIRQRAAADHGRGRIGRSAVLNQRLA